MPTPVRDYYIFDGWWTQRGGNEITAETIAPAIEDAPERLYAHWTEAKEIYEVILTPMGERLRPGARWLYTESPMAHCPQP